MAICAQARPDTLTTVANHAPLVSRDDLRALAADPAMLPAASAYARRFYPNTSLARAA